MTKEQQTVLVTGINGFVGSHLAQELAKSGHEVLGVSTQDELNPEIKNVVKRYYKCDLTVQKEVNALPWKNINSIIHLAGLSAVGPSFDSPQVYMDVNTGVLISIFEAILGFDLVTFPKIISISTGAVYAPSSDSLTEDSKVKASSPYAVSKLATELIVSHYRSRGFQNSVSIRPFNHIGPGQGEGFLLPDLAKQINECPKDGEIKVGNLKTSRDYTDVRDVVRAYRLLVEANNLPSEIYNVCSGNSKSGEEILNMVKRVMNRDDIKVSVDQSKIRPNDNPYVCGSYEKIKEDANWSPQIPLEKTVEDFIKNL